MRVLIPAKGFAGAKQRLSGILGAADRATLAAAMLQHTLGVVQQVFPAERVTVVTRSAAVRQAVAGSASAHMCRAEGLNAELAEAAADVAPPLLVLHADLPLLDAAALDALLAPAADVVLAPDRAGTGTNALLQRRPPFFFAFGPGSAARHRQHAATRGLTCASVRRAALAHDFDDANDWRALEEAIGAPLTLARLLAFLGR